MPQGLFMLQLHSISGYPTPLADAAICADVLRFFFVHNKAEGGKTDVETHIEHLRKVLLCMRENRLFANIDKCLFGATEIPFLGCYPGKDGIRADPEKIRKIAQWPTSTVQKDMQKWLSLAYYLHKYSEQKWPGH